MFATFNSLYFVCINPRISNKIMANMILAKFQTFMTVSNTTCYTTGILTRLVGHVQY